MRNVFAVCFLVGLQVVWGQKPGELRPSSTQLDRQFQQEMMERLLLDPGVDKQLSARRAAKAQVLEFNTKVQHFVELWQSFAEELNGQKTFNVKLAKKVSKAFHDLENSDGWPVGRTH